LYLILVASGPFVVVVLSMNFFVCKCFLFGELLVVMSLREGRVLALTLFRIWFQTVTCFLSLADNSGQFSQQDIVAGMRLLSDIIFRLTTLVGL
jgi:hypothetical protein